MAPRTVLTFGIAFLVASGALVATAPMAVSTSWPLVSGGYTLETIAYDGFSYGAGTIANRTGGTGWSNAWAGDPHAGWQDFVTDQSGLTYAGLPTDDSAIRAAATGGNNSDTWRILDDSVDSGVVYFQFLSTFQTNHGGGTPNIRLFYGPSQTGGIGNNGFAPSNMALMDAALNPIAISTAPLTQLNLTVLRIDYSQNKTSMWLNPNMATFDYANPPADDTYVNGFAPPIDQVYLISRYGSDAAKDKFDEIRIMRLVAPSPPPPPPPTPATAPLGVSAVAGDAAATVSWSAPVAPGSFPITTYHVQSSPSGRGCLTSETSCDVVGLTNGLPYTFRVRALTGAGWGDWSAYSPAVTPERAPQPSITIVGSRGEGPARGRIRITGFTTLIGMGAIVHPWTRAPGNVAFRQSSAEVLVGMNGTFMWERRARGLLSIYLATPDGKVRSNTVTIR